MKEFKTEFYNVKYLENQEIKDAVFNAIVEWCKKHELFAGECIMQSDAGTIEAAPLLADIVDDIIKFEVR